MLDGEYDCTRKYVLLPPRQSMCVFRRKLGAKRRKVVDVDVYNTLSIQQLTEKNPIINSIHGIYKHWRF